MKNLRLAMRQMRQQIQGEKRRDYSQRASLFLYDFLKKNATDKKVALFLSTKEEIDSDFLIKRLWQDDFTLFIPIVNKNKLLQWREFSPNTPLQKSAFNLYEPSLGRILQSPPNWIITPLVAYDLDGNRLGMGGGFYDYSFAHKIRGQAPYLIGMAYACQQVQALNKNAWDIPLDALANENEFISFSLRENKELL